MSKILSITYDELRHSRVFRINPKLQPIHYDYGLWILLWHRSTGPNSQIHLQPDPRYYTFYNISHLLSGNGWLWTPEAGRKNYNPGEAVMLAPGIIQDYNGYDSFEEDFVCFGGPLADHLFKSGIIQPGIFHMGATRRLLPIIELAADPSRNAQIQANLALQNLLVKIYLERQQDSASSHHSAVVGLINQLINQPEKWWTVEEMAEMIHLSVNQFIRLFSAHTGLTPKKYLDHLKIKQAAELLRSSNTPVSQVAERYGYRDQFHFSKRFKELTGLSPTEYRRKGF